MLLGCMKHLNLTSLSSRRNLEFGRRVLYIVSEDAFRMYETPKLNIPEFMPKFGIWLLRLQAAVLLMDVCTQTKKDVFDLQVYSGHLLKAF